MRLFCQRPYWSNSVMANVHPTSRRILILLFDFLIIVSIAYAADDSDALLRLKVSFNNAGVLQSWQPGSEPCNEKQPWEGVICNAGSVYGIRLEGLNLSGSLDVYALLQLHELRTLSFISNSFSGEIPALNKLVPLRALYLSENQFSGEIPGDYFAGMKYLKKLWLSSNKFSGPIPPSLDHIPLIELHLEDNQFSGAIPDLNQPSITDINLSNNNLTGLIPPGLSRFDKKTFEGNPGLCGEKAGKPCDKPPKESPPTEPPKEPPPKENENKHGDGNDNKPSIIWIMIVSAIIVVLIILLLLLLTRRRKRNPELPKENVPKQNVNVVNEMNESATVVPVTKDTSIKVKPNVKSAVKVTGVREDRDLIMVNEEKGGFGLADLMKAAAEVLGNGSLGSSYKAVVSNNFTVVVKRVKEMNKLPKEEFDAGVRRLGRIKHKNVLAPLAYHYRKEEKLLITEYMPTGSLLYLLHGDRGSPNMELKWPVRLKIIQGIARGLFYIHKELPQLELPHGNLKSSNVLLSHEFEPLLSDYGFSSLTTSTQASQALFAYKSPEALHNQQVSPRSDVYCLGIIVLELLTGKFPSQYVSNGSGGIDIVQWARSAMDEGREIDLFDPDIASSTNSLPEMKQLLHIGVAFTEPEPGKRLDIREAVSRIEAFTEPEPGKRLDIREAVSRIEALHYEGSSSQQPHSSESISFNIS